MQNQYDFPLIKAIAPYINGAIYLYLWYTFPVFFTALTSVLIVLIILFAYFFNEQQIKSLENLGSIFVAASLLLLMLLTAIVVIMLFMGYAPLIVETMGL